MSRRAKPEPDLLSLMKARLLGMAFMIFTIPIDSESFIIFIRRSLI
jgi:hypothetical protein